MNARFEELVPNMKPKLFLEPEAKDLDIPLTAAVVSKDQRRTQLAWAIKWYLDTGWEIDVCQRTVRCGKIAVTFDLFGFGDLYAFRDEEHLIIQATSGQHHAERLKKICGSVLARKWHQASDMNFIHVISQNTRAKGVKVEKGQIRLSQLIGSDFMC